MTGEIVFNKICRNQKKYICNSISFTKVNHVSIQYIQNFEIQTVFLVAFNSFIQFKKKK